MLPRLCSLTSSVSVRVSIKSFHTTSMGAARRWKDKTTPTYTSEFVNPVREVAGMNAPPPENGHIYDNRPHKMTVKAGCTYNWCGCGMARTEQPLCDFSCQNLFFKKIMKGGPVKYVATETKEVWFCNCKQTKNKPFCDGSHRQEEVQKHRFDGQRQLWEPRKSNSKQ